MIVDLGKTIEFLRKGKNIPVKMLIEGVVSRSHYYRIVNNQSEMSAVIFLKLLDRVNVSVEEFIFIGNSFKEDEFTQIFLQSEVAFSRRNVSKLEELKEISNVLYKNTGIEKYMHISLIMSLLVKRLRKCENYYELEPLQHYLLNLDFFTHYDLVIYITISFAFSKKLNKLLTKQILDTAYKYNNLNRNESELVKVLVNIIICELEDKDLKEVKKLIRLLINLQVDDGLFLERCVQKFFEGILLILEGDSQNGILVSRKYVVIFQETGNHYWNLLNDIIVFTIRFSENLRLRGV